MSTTMPQPSGQLSDAEMTSLKQEPGVWEAYQGLQRLEFKALAISGATISISPTRIAEFQCSPPSVKQAGKRPNIYST